MKSLLKTLDKLHDLWTKHDFEIFVGFCILIIVLIFIYRRVRGMKGTWTDYYYYPDPSTQSTPYLNTRTGKIATLESKGELECKRVMQILFQKPFIKARPNFLRNPVTENQYNLELDCYNPELRLAVEYNGKQHYQYVPYFHRNKEHFLNQKYRDELKRRMCRDNNILLIEVPYTVPIHKIQTYLEAKLTKNGYILNSTFI